jgi:chorismate synthase
MKRTRSAVKEASLDIALEVQSGSISDRHYCSDDARKNAHAGDHPTALSSGMESGANIWSTTHLHPTERLSSDAVTVDDSETAGQCSEDSRPGRVDYCRED